MPAILPARSLQLRGPPEYRQNYQRGSRRSRAWPRSRPRPPPPPPPNRWPPPPPPFGRSVFGLASLMVNVRPPSSVPLSAATALSAALASVISTNPKPRERPVSRSFTRVTFSTAPWGSNTLRSSASVVLWGRLPTYRFFIAFPLSVNRPRLVLRSSTDVLRSRVVARVCPASLGSAQCRRRERRKFCEMLRGCPSAD